MKYVNGWYLPDTEKHFEDYLNHFKNTPTKGTYQHKQRQKSFEFVRDFKNAIDIGSNVGFWSKDICKKFEFAHLFEPFEINIECLKKNLNNFKNFKIYNFALSNQDQHLDLHFNPFELGGSTLNPKQFDYTKKINVECKTLDSFNFQNISYIKIDVQFYELEVLLGATKTLVENDALLTIECSRRNKEEEEYVKKIINFLNSINYFICGHIGKEIFFIKDKNL